MNTPDYIKEFRDIFYPSSSPDINSIKSALEDFLTAKIEEAEAVLEQKHHECHRDMITELDTLRKEVYIAEARGRNAASAQ